MNQLAELQAATPERGGHCRAATALGRLLVQAVAPGAQTDAPGPSELRWHCWQQHAWVLAMLGFAVPTAVVIALQQHAQQQEQRQRSTQAAPLRHEQQGAKQALLAAADLQQRQQACACAGLAAASVAPCSCSGLGTPRAPGVVSSNKAPGGHTARLPAVLWLLDHPTTQLVAQLAQQLLLLLPVGALLWACLELYTRSL